MRIISKKFWFQFYYEPRRLLYALQNNSKGSLYWAVRFLTFWRVVFGEYWLNHCMTRGSALAFTLLLTLIPLMASLSSMLNTMIEVHPEQVEEIVTLFLPFAPPTVLDQVSNFFENAQKLRGIGVIVLVVFSVGLFGAVEESLDTVWKIRNSRSFLKQLVTFTVVMVWGPLFFSASFWFRRSGWFDFVTGYFFPLDFLPFLLVVLGFSTLLWLMPNTRVKARSAFLGGLVAGTLFELERWGFGTYIRLSIQTRTIYGAYGIFPFFLVSLFIVSLFVLFGAEVSYVHQNFLPLLRARRRWDRRASDYKTYISVRMLVDIVDVFLKRKQPPCLTFFMSKYELTEPQARGLINFLVHEGYVHAVNGAEGFVPAYDLSQTPVKDVFNKIENESRQITPVPNDSTRDYVSGIMAKLSACTHPDLEILTFQKLIQELDRLEIQPKA